MKQFKRILTYPLLTFILVLSNGISSVSAAPEEPFAGAAPNFNDKPPEPTNHNVGEWGVSDQRGAATYTFPIDLPPGRNDMQPELNLRYSSQSALRGGVAVGWSLEMPSIRLDRSLGNEAEPTYTASLGSVSGRLVEVPDASPYFNSTAYRAEFDETFTRFFKIKDPDGVATWIALSLDGVRHHFEKALSNGTTRTRWHITRQIDPFGNMVSYQWTDVHGSNGQGAVIDTSLTRIEYSANQGANLVAHAKVEFEYDPLQFCGGTSVPVGAISDADGLVEGAQRLGDIVTYVRDENSTRAPWRLSKRVSLYYDLSDGKPVIDGGSGNSLGIGPIPCKQAEAPLRYLKQINVAAYDLSGTETKLPPMKFTYNRKAPALFGPQIISTPGFAHHGTWEGAQGSLLDLNSDGVQDRVSVAEENGVCVLSWQQGLIGGGFDTIVRKSPLPTANWLGDHPTPLGANETCNFNGQVAYRVRPVIGGQTEEWGVLSYHFMDWTGDGQVDLLTNIWAAVDHASYVPQSPFVNASAAPMDVDDPPDGPNTPQPLQMTPEGYIWRVYPNIHEGISFHPDPDALFSATPIVVTGPTINPQQPFRPVFPPSSGENGFIDTGSNSSIPTLADLDGDGFTDFIDVGTHPKLLGSGSGTWEVYFGSGSTTFGPKVLWHVPEVDLPTTGRGFEVDTSNVNHSRTTTAAMLRDMNGDRLPDLVVQETDQQLKFYRNTGRGFSGTPIHLGLLAPVEETLTSYTRVVGNRVLDGTRVYLRRLMDVDADGRTDMVTFPDPNTATGKPRVYFNAGDRFLAAQDLSANWIRGHRFFEAVDGNWQLESDLMDGDGNGTPDLVRWLGDGTQLQIQDLGYSAGPRLLRSVENGRGLRMDFRYKPSTDPAVVNWNPIDLETHLPSPQWLVTEVTVKAGYGTPDQIQRYTYENPAYLATRDFANVPEIDSFLGFRKTVMTTAPADGTPAQRIERAYQYDDNSALSGSLAQEWIYHEVEGAFQIDRYKETQWVRKSLFGDKVFFVYPDQTLTRTCEPGVSASTCMTQTSNVHRMTETWTPQAPATGDITLPELYVRSVMQEGSGLTFGPLDRRTSYQHELRYGPATSASDDYRILVTQELLEDASINHPQLVLAGKTETAYDTATGPPVEIHRHMNDTQIAISRLVYDPTTGNRAQETRPNQTASGGAGMKISYSYGPHRLFVRNTINELGHTVITIYDVATGALVEQQGPNSKPGPFGNDVYETQTWKVDGFGRQLEHAISLEGQNTPYLLHTIEKTTWFDHETPSRIREEKLRDIGGSVWITTDQTADGLGRLLTESQFLSNGAKAIKRYSYDGAGNLTAVHVPDPRLDDGSTVQHDYDHDGLGRQIRHTQPDGNGVSTTHTGLEKKITEETSDGSGATKTEVYDVLGRLVEVSEENAATGTAITTYGYDARDNLNRITDADGNVTAMTHDLLNNRTQITRGARTWLYTYDLNGNVLIRRAPVPTNANPADYTVIHDYDALDRVTRTTFREPVIQTLPPLPNPFTPLETTSPSPGEDASPLVHQFYLPLVTNQGDNQKDVQDGEQQAKSAATAASNALQTSEIHYTYDTGINGIGRLTEIHLPFASIFHTHDARGLVKVEKRTLSLSGVATLKTTQMVSREYNALGQPTHSTWNDGHEWQISYDERGLVDTVEWFDPEQGIWQPVADYERALAGTPRTRSSAFNQSRQFTYDLLGRLRTDTILAGTSAVANRIYTYNDAGNLRNVDGQTLGMAATAHFTYDAQHRLLTANGPQDYSGAFTYSKAGNIETAHIEMKQLSAGLPDLSRNVRYEYGLVDPQAVDQLIDRDTKAIVGRFHHDLSGNMISRSAGDGRQALRWDGLDHIRMVEGPNGTEVYFYDHRGQRMLAANRRDGVRFWFGERETHFTLDGKLMRGYLHLTHQGIALARVEDGKTIELQYADALRNLMLAMESNGTVKASFLYGPFGEVLHATGQQNHRRQFNGKENDSMTTLRYYGFRYYDPLTLRWNSADPLYRVLPDIGLAEPQRLNLYSFTLNNPVNYFDPDGRDSKKSQKAKGNEPHPDKPGKCDIRVNECRQKKNEMTNKKRALRSEIRSLRKRRNDMDIQRMNTKQKLRDMEDFWKRVGDSQLHPKTWESGWELKQRYKNQGEYIKRRNNEIRQAKQELKQVERELELIDATDAVVKASENGLLSIDNSYQRSNAEVMFLILDTIGPIMR